MSLAIRHGDTHHRRGQRVDADFAIAALVELIEGGMGEGGPVAAAADRRRAVRSPVRVELPKDGVLRGVMAAPGLAIGKAVRFVGRDHRA
jgi:hypothetical protein